MTALTRPLVLASTSRYRLELLTRLGLPFTCQPPTCEEMIQPGENSADMACRLAAAKASSLAATAGNALIIGSDQTAEVEGRLLSKPGSRARAIEQLEACSGKTVRFHTGVALLNIETGRLQVDQVLTEVRFRILPVDRITRYLDREDTLNCAGSFKAEGLGITLFESMTSHDPTAIVGLPLIRLTSMLLEEGFAIP